MSAVLPSPRVLPLAWRRALPAFGLAVLAVLVLYRHTFAAMEEIWSRSGTFAHAYLVPPIVVWLIWRRRGQLLTRSPQPLPWVLLPILLAAAAWLLGDMAGVNAVTQLAATTLLVLTVPALLGRAVARDLAFPLAFLYFMVPLGEFLLPTLMRWTADFTVFAVGASGVPVYREGLQFIIPTGSWSVVEACSGVRYLIASFMVGTLFAYLNYTSLRRRLAFCLVALLVPIIANWLRAYMIVMIGHLSGNKLAVGVDHLIYGWIFFGVVVMLMFFIGARWSEAAPQPAERLAENPVLKTAHPAAASWWPAVLLVTVLVLPHALLLPLNAAGAVPLAGLALPPLADAQTPSAEPPLLAPTFEGAAAQTSRSYETQQGTVTVHVAYYRQQGYGRKLVSSNNVLAKSEDHAWNHTSSGHVSLPAQGQQLTFRTAEVLGSPAAGQRLRFDVRQIYWVDGHFTASDHVALVRGIASRLLGRGDDGAMLTLYTEGAPEASSARLQQFVQAHLGELEVWLQAVRRQH